MHVIFLKDNLILLHHATELYVQYVLILMLKIIVYWFLLVPFFLAVCLSVHQIHCNLVE
jgi:hypothetical protein